jgi:glutamine amidotransferase
MNAQKLILPGVGAFDWAMERLNGSGLKETLETLVLCQKVPILGICVGMQMMAKRSDEGILPGLGWFDAEVIRFKPDSQCLPHMGWNNVTQNYSNSLFNDLIDPRFYFLHSYFFSPCDPHCSLATTDYGIEFTSAAVNENIFGVQFHPEKSHHWGMKLLQNFVEL